MKNVLVGGAAMLALSFVVGCSGGGREKTANATGVITLDGKPIEGARVLFHPKEGGSRSSHGTTDAQGKFKMSTFGMNDGALLGKHAVTITKAELPEEAKFDAGKLKEEGYGGMPGYGEMMGVGKGKKIEETYVIPKKYSDRTSSGIEVEVTDGGPNEFTFNLDN